MMPFNIVYNDITKMKVDAIVNAANVNLQMGGGVCGAIFRAAGAAQLQAACDKLAPIKTGEAVITPGFALPVKFIIHAVGPVYQRQNAEQCQKLLRSAYIESLRLAVANKCESIAFPLISSGIYGYPKDEALQVAVSAIRDFLYDYDINVTLVIFDKSAYIVSRDLIGPVERYIDEHYMNSLATSEDKIHGADEPFSQALTRLIDAKGMTDVEVYRRANIDRKLFFKIRNSKDYMPNKRTAIALAVALKLSLNEMQDLLKRAGYTLSHADKFDVIMEYFIANGKYDIFEINEVLFKYDQPLLEGYV